ncbi:hypothetical protein [Achromobacter aloeverae]
MSDAMDTGAAGLNPMLVVSEDYGESNPQVVVRIMVDTSAVLMYANNDVINRGIYMIDNRALLGSAYEGTMELNTHVRARDWIAFYITPIDPTLEDEVGIIGFRPSSGDAFGDDGIPVLLPTSSTSPEGPYWVGRIDNSQNMTYQIKCRLRTGGENSRTVVFVWDPYISVVV